MKLKLAKLLLSFQIRQKFNYNLRKLKSDIRYIRFKIPQIFF